MLARDYSTVVDPVFVDVPRGARGYQLLHTVIHKQIRSQIGLADYLGIDRTVMPYVIDDLVSAGYVERAADPTDRRIRTVVATAAGLDKYAELSDEVLRAEQRFFATLDDADRATFVRVLSQLAHRPA
ncbi:winged helix DNA-binding protein [Gordonia sp. TBRC 11910]|uniref:Winged helix DNA-binding protein n=2 Tax=Gordonia asplenii TaxID=2725283 RepID=A0A848KXJ8_9ACTN|nr:winged helix DNA-binding protein [Gordonia asplenii]